MLQDKAGKITGFVQPPGMNFAFACHQATLCWLYSEAFGSAPDIYAYTDTKMNASQRMTGELSRFGAPLNRPAVGNFQPPAGTILSFSYNGDAKHSCVALANGKIGGYNQLD